MKPLSVLLMGSALALPRAAEAVNIQFCVKHSGYYDDSWAVTQNNPGEDNWRGNGEKLARGAYVIVYRSNPYYSWSGYLGNGSGSTSVGCTPTLSPSNANGRWEIRVHSYGYVNSNYVRAIDEASGSTLVSINFVDVADGGAGTPYTLVADVGTDTYNQLDPFDIFNVHQAGAYALYRHRGGNSGQYFDFWITNHTDYNEINGHINIHYGNADLKFIIVHEAGHRMADLRTGFSEDEAVADGSYHDDPGPDDCPGEGSDPNNPPGHSMRSEEYNGKAVSEGFGHFYAADVWNNDDETDCWFEYYRPVAGDNHPVVNCDSSADNDPPFEQQWYFNNCDPISGNGVELDWLRAFWNVHTEGAAPDPSFTEIMDWFDTAVPWDRDSAYTNLNNRANQLNNDLEANWNATKGLGANGNGIFY